MESCDPAPHPENQQHLVGISVSTQTDPFFNVPVTFAPESWNLMEQLLVGTNLSEYSGVFRANHIDLNMFSHMTEEDFNNIGITSFGAKKILLEAIKAMRG
ncbi:protein bicaudal C-like [Daphnia pulicaria]|uniref:protein bicaudal C-like n=1 Tax=Daphnia pulicaria TaxID=35523 RepID=UPI001EEA78F0|nr:protein bicaudal C-like [Daphnia pulicaria]